MEIMMNNILLAITTLSYVMLAILFIVLLSILVFFLARKKPTPEGGFDVEYFNLIYEALGGTENIIQAVTAHHRLQITVVNMKKVSGSKFRELQIPAFVKGKDITLLIKKHTQEVLSYIQERKKEDN